MGVSRGWIKKGSFPGIRHGLTVSVLFPQVRYRIFREDYLPPDLRTGPRHGPWSGYVRVEWEG